MDKPWLKHYPQGVPSEIDVAKFASVGELLKESFREHLDRDAFQFMGRSFGYGLIDRLSDQFAAYLQSSGLKKGDRVAIMMPNVPQYPVVAAGIFKAGLVVVNVNPLYTPRELEHQLRDSGAKLIVILENFAHTLEKVISATPCHQVVLASVGDMLPAAQGSIVNFALRHIKKLVPPHGLKQAVRFNDTIKQGKRSGLKHVEVKPDDIAALQYTGGTTGVSKGATLLHRNLVANILQCHAWYEPVLGKANRAEQMGVVCALPLYHIYAFSLIMLFGISVGGKMILIPNPRDIEATIQALRGQRIHIFPGVNTLFNVLARNAGFQFIDWSHLLLTMSAGMATQKATADLWLEKTGCPIFEGYGLSESSPMATNTPINETGFTGSIGMPVPNTEVVLFDDDGQSAPVGQPGEIGIRGPQVMSGYWNRPDETAKVLRPDGFLLTGDIGVMDTRGYIKIVDRKKDMILVSGFNVYPNEIEDVVTQMPGVLECAAIGVVDDRSGESVKVFVVRAKANLSETDVRAWCEQNLTAYKRPRQIVFVPDLPKSPIGKVLRRELRDMKTHA